MYGLYVQDILISRNAESLAESKYVSMNPILMPSSLHD